MNRQLGIGAVPGFKSCWRAVEPAGRRAIRTLRIKLAVCLAAATCSACSSFGGGRLNHDQVDYARSLASAQKRETLSNIVELRYADSPSFLPVTQIIAAYNFDVTANPSLSSGTATGIGTTGVLGATLGYSNHPTFTFSPTTGEEFAEGYIRPMAPSLVLPLIQSGVPIDLLLRIVVQSIGDLQNSAALSGSQNSGSIGFYELIGALRRLQLKGAIAVRFIKQDGGNRVFLDIDPQQIADAAVSTDARRVRELMQIKEGVKEVEIVYGAVPEKGAAVALVTRSILGVLTEIGAQIAVPEADVQRHATFPTVPLIGVETRPTIIIHVGPRPSANAYADIQYGETHYWIEHDDFDSKFAFSVVQNLIALAEASQNGKAPLVTIPAS